MISALLNMSQKTELQVLLPDGGTNTSSFIHMLALFYVADCRQDDPPPSSLAVRCRLPPPLLTELQMKSSVEASVRAEATQSGSAMIRED